MKVYAFFEMSKDGYIAGYDNNFEGFRECHKKLPSGETFGFKDLINKVDAILMGRKTFDFDKTMKDWWYMNKPVFVLTRTPSSVMVPEHIMGKVIVLSGNPVQLLEDLADRGFKSVYVVGGGEVLKSFMDENLIDDLMVVTLPFELGDGITPFLPKHWQKMIKISTVNYGCGFVKTFYRPNERDTK